MSATKSEYSCFVSMSLLLSLFICYVFIYQELCFFDFHFIKGWSCGIFSVIPIHRQRCFKRFNCACCGVKFIWYLLCLCFHCTVSVQWKTLYFLWLRPFFARLRQPKSWHLVGSASFDFTKDLNSFIGGAIAFFQSSLSPKTAFQSMAEHLFSFKTFFIG